MLWPNQTPPMTQPLKKSSQSSEKKKKNPRIHLSSQNKQQNRYHRANLPWIDREKSAPGNTSHDSPLQKLSRPQTSRVPTAVPLLTPSLLSFQNQGLSSSQGIPKKQGAGSASKPQVRKTFKMIFIFKLALGVSRILFS